MCSSSGLNTDCCPCSSPHPFLQAQLYRRVVNFLPFSCSIQSYPSLPRPRVLAVWNGCAPFLSACIPCLYVLRRNQTTQLKARIHNSPLSCFRNLGFGFPPLESDSFFTYSIPGHWFQLGSSAETATWLLCRKARLSISLLMLVTIDRQNCMRRRLSAMYLRA